MKIVDTDLVTFLLLQIEATKMQLELSNKLFNALPDTTTLRASLNVRRKIIDYKARLIDERIRHISYLIALESELKEVLP